MTTESKEGKDAKPESTDTSGAKPKNLSKETKGFSETCEINGETSHQTSLATPYANRGISVAALARSLGNVYGL